MGKAEHRLTFWRLVRRSLRFHARAHLGVVLGAVVGSAALIGALIVGDSVRETLKARALERLGGVHYALYSPDRCFEATLAERLGGGAQARPARVVPGEPAYIHPESAQPLSTALLLPGVVAKGDGSARANAVNVMGVDALSWPRLAGWNDRPNPYLQALQNGPIPLQQVLRRQFPQRDPVRDAWQMGRTAFLNETLARQLGVKVGDDLVVRVRKPSALGWEVALSPRDQTSVALRVTVGAILGPGKLGDFSLSAQPLGAANLFLPLDVLQARAGAAGQANLLVFGAVEEKPKFSRWDRQRYDAANWLLGRLSRRTTWTSNPGQSGPGFVRVKGNAFQELERGLDLGLARWVAPKLVKAVGDEVAVPWLEARLNESWSLKDAGLSVRAVAPSPAVMGGERRPAFAEVTSSRLFLEAPVAAAALRPRTAVLTNHAGFLYDTPYSVAASGFVTNGVSILTYLANSLCAGERLTPYSMVTAANGPYVPPDLREDEMLVNEWLAEDLSVKPGDAVSMSYYVADSGSRLVERTNVFRVRGVVPLKGLYASRTLMPEFPGLAQAESTHEWDAGFPLVYKIREKDEAYWKQSRGTPKAFISLAAGQKLWANRFGALTAIRYPVPPGELASDYRDAASRNLLANLKPADVGLRIEPVRGQALRAAMQGQDFGQLFLGFSFFLVVAALLLMALLFQFGLEQRAGEVGTLRALGFTAKQIRRLFLAEGAVLALVGGVLGTFGGYGYAHAMLWGLATIWRNAVGGSVLTFYATPLTLIIGLGASTLVAVGTIWLTLRRMGRAQAQVSGLKSQVSRGLGGGRSVPISTPLQRGESRGADGTNRFNGLPAGEETVETVSGSKGATSTPLKRGVKERGRMRWNGWGMAGGVAGLGAVGLVIWVLARGDTANAGAFFGAGALLLLAGLGFAAAWLERLAQPAERGIYAASTSAESCAPKLPGTPEAPTVKRHECRAPEGVFSSRGALALRGCARRRNRSLATIALLACGCFLIVAVGAFRLDANQHPERRASGTGGFAFIGNATLPLLHDLNSRAGREAYGLSPEDLQGVTCVPFRVRAGDDASCLSLARSQKPRLLGVNPDLLAGRFTFTHVARGCAREWSILKTSSFSIHTSSFSSGEVPAVADANTLEWGLGKKVGDTLDYTDDLGRPFKVRLVGAVANSILQGSLVIDEAEFVRHFPNESGYRMVLLDAPADALAPVSATLSRALQDLGLELTSAPERLRVLNAVENTYLSTFQVLGGLGLLLGSAGLGVVVLRNVLERRAELALLLAVGFRRCTLHRLVLLEHAALLAAGLGIGIGAAAVAVLPALWSARAALPYGSLALTLAAVCLNGLLWAWLATRYALRGNIIQALRKE